MGPDSTHNEPTVCPCMAMRLPVPANPHEHGARPSSHICQLGLTRAPPPSVPHNACPSQTPSASLPTCSGCALGSVKARGGTTHQGPCCPSVVQPTKAPAVHLWHNPQGPLLSICGTTHKGPCYPSVAQPTRAPAVHLWPCMHASPCSFNQHSQPASN